MMRRKDYESTDSEGKIEAVSWANTISLWVEGLWLTLVGHHSGLSRHIQEAAEFGYAPSAIRIAEHSPKTCLELKVACVGLLQPDQILYGDVLDRIDSSYGVVDLDFATPWCPHIERCVRKAIECNVANIRVTICQFTGKNQYIFESCPPELLGDYNLESGGVKRARRAPRQKVILPGILERMCRDKYDIHIKPYTGKKGDSNVGGSPMLMAVLNRR